MNDSDCAQILELLSAYLDDELPPATCQQLETHLHGCPECVEFVESLKRSMEMCRQFGNRRETDALAEEDMARLRAAYHRMLARRGRPGAPRLSN